MALDVGTKTIGIAISDPLGMLAHPVTTLARKGVRHDTAQIATLITDRKVDWVIVGLPLELDGTEERSARLARQIGASVRASTGLRVGYLDERYSSVDAERQLIEADVSRSRRKQIIDQQAAVIILQSFLDSGESAVLEEEA